MFIGEMALAFFVALFFAGTLLVVLHRRGPGPLAGFLFFFVLLFLGAWAAGVWARPFGPTIGGISWAAFLFSGLIVTLLLAALIPPSRGPAPAKAEAAQAPVEEAVSIALGFFFWFLIALLMASIFVRYLAPVPA